MQTDDQFLTSMGLDGLTGKQKQESLNDILYTLNINIAKRVSKLLKADQFGEFEALLDKEASQAEISQWLQQNVPHYSQIVEQEAKKMRAAMQQVKKAVI